MEGNDIGVTLINRVAVMFEGLIYIDTVEPAIQVKRGILRRKTVDVADLTLEQQVRRWRPRELPLKSLLHMVNQLHQRVEVYTYFNVEFVPHIETWLQRKGVSVPVYSYVDLEALRDDFRFNREVTTLYTPYEDDVPWLGYRCNVMSLDGTWGF